MAIAGIIGGIGPESTIVYYREILALYRSRHAEPAQPHVIVNSVDAMEMLGYVNGRRVGELTAFLVGAVKELAAAGATFALIAANTPHIVFDAVQAQSKIPLISIVEATSRFAQRAGLKRFGVLGTRTIMGGSLYRDTLARAGIDVFSPTGADLEYVHNAYMTELFNGIVRRETHDELMRIVGRLRASAQIDCVVLGGTELTIILNEKDDFGVPLLDTAKIHAAEAVKMLVGEPLV